MFSILASLYVLVFLPFVSGPPPPSSSSLGSGALLQLITKPELTGNTLYNFQLGLNCLDFSQCKQVSCFAVVMFQLKVV